MKIDFENTIISASPVIPFRKSVLPDDLNIEIIMMNLNHIKRLM